jgi:hypothetical protein
MRPVLGLPSGSGSIVAQPVKIGTIFFINCEIGHWFHRFGRFWDPDLP